MSAKAEPLDSARSRQIKAARAALGLTRAELAEQIGVDPSTIRRWETEQRPVPAWAAKFAKTLLDLRAARERAATRPAWQNKPVPVKRKIQLQGPMTITYHGIMRRLRKHKLVATARRPDVGVIWDGDRNCGWLTFEDGEPVRF